MAGSEVNEESSYCPGRHNFLAACGQVSLGLGELSSLNVSAAQSVSILRMSGLIGVRIGIVVNASSAANHAPYVQDFEAKRGLP